MFPAAASADIMLWRGGRFTGSPLARTAYRLGPSGDQAMQGAGALSVPEIQAGSLHLGGYINRDPGAALPSAFSLGLAWDGGRFDWGDSRTRVGAPGDFLLDRTLQSTRLNVTLPAGSLSIVEGSGRVRPRHVILAGAGSPGPYSIQNDSPVLPDTVTVRVNGEALPASAYSLDPAGGWLTLEDAAPGPGSAIDVRYEEAAEEGQPSERILGSSFQFGSAASHITVAMLSHLPDGGSAPSAAASPETGASEGPFYGSGGPMALRLSRGPVTRVDTVLADGIPLLANLDYLAFPTDRLVYVTRPIPQGAVVVVDYHYQAQASGSSAAPVLSISGRRDGSGDGRQTRIDWNVSRSGSAAAGKIALRTPLPRSGLNLAIRLQGAETPFRLDTGLDNARRQNGADIGLAFSRGAYTGSISLVDASVPSLMPFLDSDPAAAGPAVELRGLRLRGDITPPSRPCLRWDIQQMTEGGRPYRRQEAVLGYRRDPWSVSVSLGHLLTAMPAGAASAVSPSIRFGPFVRLETEGATASFLAHSGARFSGAADLSAGRTQAAGLADWSRSARLTFLAIPAKSLVFSAAAASSSRTGAALPGEAAYAGPSIIAADDFDPATVSNGTPETEQDTVRVRSAPRAGGEASITSSENLAPPGSFDNVSPPGAESATGFSLAPGRSAAAFVLPARALPPGGWNEAAPGPSQSVSAQLTWQVSGQLALSARSESEQFNEIGTGISRWETSMLEARLNPLLSPEQGHLQMSAVVGEIQSSVGAAGESASPRAGIELEFRQPQGWRFTGNLGRSLWGCSSPSLLPRSASAPTVLNSQELEISHPIGYGMLASVEWQTHGQSGSGAFRSDIEGISLTLPVGLGMGVRLQALRTTLRSSIPLLNYASNSLALSLVSFAP